MNACTCPRDGSRLCERCHYFLTYAEGVSPPVATPLPLSLATDPPRNPSWPYRSKTELLYTALLEEWQRDGLVQRWRYEALRLTLAPRTTLTVDFYLLMGQGAHLHDMRPQLHEVKGFAREDALVKLKQAAVLYPEFRFFLVQRRKQEWHWKEIPCH